MRSPMYMFAALVGVASLADFTLASGDHRTYTVASRTIVRAARRDGIDLGSLNFTTTVLDSIQALTEGHNVIVPEFGNASKIDVHVHVVPEWYRTLVSTTGGSPTPAWDVQSHLQFMANNSIARSVIAVSAPAADVFPGDQRRTAALARLLNEYMAALSRAYPERFSFYAAVPLPHSEAAIVEAHHALDRLSAVGIGCLSNHEGRYLGNRQLTPFFAALDARNTSKEIIYIHPAEPVTNTNDGTLTSANPTLYASGLVEFYFETARTIMDLTLTSTILNFTSLNFVIPHVGGAFPAIEDRFLKSTPPAFEARVKQVYATRFWWDSAGPTYFAQVKGLLGCGEATSQLLFGTDYPYAPSFVYASSIAAINNADFLNATEKAGVFAANAKRLFERRIPAM